jgi:hypothetical protein
MLGANIGGNGKKVSINYYGKISLQFRFIRKMSTDSGPL